VSTELGSYIDESTNAGLQRLLPGAILEPIVVEGASESGVYVNLPASPGADYSFKVWLKPEMQIHAEPDVADQRSLDFWYMPFEDAEYRDFTKRDKAFLDALSKIVSHATRIVQRVGLFSHAFRCEYKRKDGWRKVYSMAYSRFGNFTVPRITGRRHIYYCRALSPGLGRVTP
jgi:hypothetical protein